jgi:hypothetical protein
LPFSKKYLVLGSLKWWCDGHLFVSSESSLVLIIDMNSSLGKKTTNFSRVFMYAHYTDNLFLYRSYASIGLTIASWADVYWKPGEMG